jgi:hypothetical protein
MDRKLLGAGQRVLIDVERKLESGNVAGTVREMKNFDEVGSFIDPIVDQDGSMHELENVVPSIHRAADVWGTS